jgi:putative acetyltransferase
MIRGLVIRPAEPEDFVAIAALVEQAFGQPDEARLVERLRADGDAVLELVALNEGVLVGHILFSRLILESDEERCDAVALAPVAVLPARQRSGIGAALIETAHQMLQKQGERLCVVLGEPAYYGRFGYEHGRARHFICDYQCEALQALAWGRAPETGRLVYPGAFSRL